MVFAGTNLWFNPYIYSQLYVMSFPFTFSNMGAIGSSGPTTITYGTSTPGYGTSYAMTLNAGIQYWTVPSTGTYQIIAAGASGGTNGYLVSSYGKGVIVSTTITLMRSQVLGILVGQAGSSSSGFYAGGGGGTFVASNVIPLSNAAPILVAGGGGGIWNTGGDGIQANGQLSTVGAAGYASGTAPTVYGGAGGLTDTRSPSAGGVGFYSIIAPDGRTTTGSTAFINGGIGTSGFGCGNDGGGGFSGGGGINYGGQGHAGGGGSYDINGTNNNATLYTGPLIKYGIISETAIGSGYNTGPGFVLIIKNSTTYALDGLTSATKSSIRGAFSLKVLFTESANYPIVNIQNSGNTASANFYGNSFGISLTTGPNGTGTTLANWLSANGGGSAYVAIWYDQSYYVNGSSTQNNATASSTQRPVVNITTNPWNVDMTTNNTYFNMVNGTIPMNCSTTLSAKFGIPSIGGNWGIMGAGVNSANGQHSLAYNAGYSGITGFADVWYNNNYLYGIGTVPNPSITTSIIYPSFTAPTATTNVNFSGGTSSTSYISAGYINGTAATSTLNSTRSGWIGQTGGDLLGKDPNDVSLQSQMFWAFISSQAICSNDQQIVEFQ